MVDSSCSNHCSAASCFPASQFASRDVLRVRQEFFVFTVKEPRLRPCTQAPPPPGCRRVGNHAIPTSEADFPPGCAFALVLRYPRVLGVSSVVFSCVLVCL